VANNGLFQHVIGKDDTVRKGNTRSTFWGNTTSAGTGLSSTELEKCGIKIISTFSGNSSVDHLPIPTPPT
jgi:nitrogenase molybdenum-iron protein alpha chain